MQPSGLLFYNGRLNEKHDFLALELVAGQVRLTYSTGRCHGDVCGRVGACAGEMGAGASPRFPQVRLCTPEHTPPGQTDISEDLIPWPFPVAKSISPRSMYFSYLSRGTLVQPVWSPVVGSDLSTQGHPGSICAYMTGGGGLSSSKQTSTCIPQQVSPTRWSAPQFQGA